MTKDKLIEDINDEITFSGALPYSLPGKDISRILDIASEYFYENWQYAYQSRYLLLPRSLFLSPEFKRHRELKLPDCIRFVHNLKEARGGGSLFGTMDVDFSDSKYIGAETMLTPFVGESLMYRAIMFSFLDLSKAFVLDTVSYDYNKNNKLLSLKGKTPRYDVVAEVAKDIELSDLYNDELFKRYVRAQARIRLGQLLQTFDYQLPGGVKINYAITVTAAEKELSDIKEDMAKQNTQPWILFYRQ